MITIYKIGKHHMDGGLYKDERGRYYCDCYNKMNEENCTIEVYQLSPYNEPDGEPNIRLTAKLGNPPSEREKREEAYRHDYMMLDMLRTHCEYYKTADAFCHGYGCEVKKVINKMKIVKN